MGQRKLARSRGARAALEMRNVPTRKLSGMSKPCPFVQESPHHGPEGSATLGFDEGEGWCSARLAWPASRLCWGSACTRLRTRPHYMTDDPAACANCHVMREQFRGLAEVLPSGGRRLQRLSYPRRTFPKYFTKALNGMNHSMASPQGTSRMTSSSPAGITGLPRAFLKCHADVTDMVRSTRSRGDSLLLHYVPSKRWPRH